MPPHRNTRAGAASSERSLPRPSRTLTIIGQDPTLRVQGRILTVAVPIPNESLSAGPRGYRVQVVDYDATANRMYRPLDSRAMGTPERPKDPYAGGPTDADAFNRRLLDDPRFHAQNAYAIVMRTLARFERALGRRVSWSFGGHQLKVAPHAFAEANAFYSPAQEALLFGYFAGRGETVFNCLSHDIVAHETAHALVDGLRPRYMEPSSPDQAAFHEGFADVVALLSVFSLSEVVEYAVGKAIGGTRGGTNITVSQLTLDSLKKGVLLGLGEQYGEETMGVHGAALRRSITIKPSRALKDKPEYLEEHRRGELLVAAVLDAFLSAYLHRLDSLGTDAGGRLPAVRVAEEGADIADRLLTMVIRALDYMPPTDISFGDFLSAVLTSDLEIRPDDLRYELRARLLEGFGKFGFEPASSYGGEAGRWEPPPPGLSYAFVHRESLQRDRDEMFRFLWDNRKSLGLCDQAYTEVGSVRPCLRIDQDGFTLRETVVDYVQILTVRAEELETIEIPGRRGRIRRPAEVPGWKTVRLLGGGALVFDEFGHLKYHIRNALLRPDRQTRRLKHLTQAGYFRRRPGEARGFGTLHMRGLAPEMPAGREETRPWQ